MNRLSRLVLVFAVFSAMLLASPALLRSPFGPYPLMGVGDAIDVLTPLIIIPLYWLLYQLDQKEDPSLSERVGFVLFASLWVQGQGMHLAANAIGHLLREMTSSDAYALTTFYDEVLSHYIWHFGMVGLSALLILRQWRNPLSVERTSLGLESLAGLIHGFTFFLAIVEGGTAPIGVAFAALVTVLGLRGGRTRLRQQPVFAFLFVTYLVATILFACWGIYWGGLPQFSQVGVID